MGKWLFLTFVAEETKSFNTERKCKERVMMDKRQQLMSELKDVCNGIICRNKLELEEALKGYSLSEIKLIEHVELIPEANVTKLAAASYMTRGAISKLTKKLIHKGFLESYQNAENKKEIYFQLTTEG